MEKKYINPLDGMGAGTNASFRIINAGKHRGIAIDAGGNAADMLMLLAIGANGLIDRMADGDAEVRQDMAKFFRAAVDAFEQPISATVIDLGSRKG